MNADPSFLANFIWTSPKMQKAKSVLKSQTYVIQNFWVVANKAMRLQQAQVNLVQIVKMNLNCVKNQLVLKITKQCIKSNTSIEIITAAKGAPIAHTALLSMHSWNRFLSIA